MKKLTIILVMLSCTAFSQPNRFLNLFTEADSVFSQLQTPQEQDSLNRAIIDEAVSLIESMDQDTLTIRASDFLLMYWTGYIDGSTYSLEKRQFDYLKLKEMIDGNRKTTKRWIDYQETQNPKHLPNEN